MDDPPRARRVLMVTWIVGVPRDPREELVDLSGVSLDSGVSPKRVALVSMGDFAENEEIVGSEDFIRGTFVLDVPGGCPLGFVT